MNKILLIAAAVIFSAASCNLSQVNLSYDDGFVELSGKKINIELANTPPKRALGLSNRESMEENQGMLFVFDKADRPTFWMKDMKFPIDIVWIKDGKVVDISLDAQPQPGKLDHELEIYSPKNEVNQVLELNAEWAKKNNVSIGDEVIIKLK